MLVQHHVRPKIGRFLVRARGCHEYLLIIPAAAQWHLVQSLEKNPCSMINKAALLIHAGTYWFANDIFIRYI
jgi:hypothetical protein